MNCFFGPLISNTYAGCSRPNFIARFALGRSVQPPKLLHNYAQIYTEMYSEPDIQNLDNLKPEPDWCRRHREETLPRVSRLMKSASVQIRDRHLKKGISFRSSGTSKTHKIRSLLLDVPFVWIWGQEVQHEWYTSVFVSVHGPHYTTRVLNESAATR